MTIRNQQATRSTRQRCPLLRSFLSGIILTLLLTPFTCTTGASELRTPEGPESFFIEGYPGKLSYSPGEAVSLHLSSSESKVSFVVERIGKERIRVATGEALEVGAHPVPARASSEGCHWPAAASVEIPSDWESGYYEVTLSISDSGGSFTRRGSRTATNKLFFVLRSGTPGSSSKILLQLSTNTYNAYTNWGGHSLYSYHDRDGIQGNQVSFQRPLTSQFYKWEHLFVSWAEANGIRLEYAANNDLEYLPELVKNYNLVLSVGHDEYWSAGMRDTLEAYIRDGGNVAFLSGNTCCWQVRNNRETQSMVCFKQNVSMDPQYRTTNHRTLSTLWSHHLIDRPENSLTGVGFLWGGYHRSHGQFMDGPGAFQVQRPDHWLFKKTNLKRNDLFGGESTIVGYECDGCEIEWRDGLPFPTGLDGTPDNFTILGICPAKWHPGDSDWYEQFPQGRVGNAVMGIYSNGGTVFTAGSTDWAHGLSGKSPAVEQITKNLLERLGNRSDAANSN